MFTVVQDPLPVLQSSEETTTTTETSSTSGSPSTVPPTPPLPPASQPPLLLPFFPPSEDLCVNIRGRRYGGPEQYVQVTIFLLPFFARYISSHCWIRADFFWMLVSALHGSLKIISHLDLLFDDISYYIRQQSRRAQRTRKKRARLYRYSKREL